MGLKEIIRRKKLIEMFGHKMEITLPGEPLIYSIKERLSNRVDSKDHFRNRMHVPRLRCEFPAYFNPNSPVVLLVNFYVSPFPFADVSEKAVKSESVAVHAYELCEYLLSFMEMMSKTLVSTYRQIVKIDCEKYYSKEPRTVVKFMSWSNYENVLRGKDPVDPPSKPTCCNVPTKRISAARERKARDKGIYMQGCGALGDSTVLGTGVSGGDVLHAPVAFDQQEPTTPVEGPAT